MVARLNDISYPYVKRSEQSGVIVLLLLFYYFLIMVIFVNSFIWQLIWVSVKLPYQMQS